ncbi:unnamed protein product, partial [Fusarium langsethiae]
MDNISPVTAHTSRKQGKMLVLQYDTLDRQVHIDEVCIPRLSNTEVLVRVKFTTLFHSDCLAFHLKSHVDKALTFPITIGHEATGVVEEVGNTVTSFHTGDNVGFHASSGCFAYKKWKAGPNIVRPEGLKGQGSQSYGCISEYAAVDIRRLVKLPTDTNFLTASRVFCAGVKAYNAIMQCDVVAGVWVALIGAGGLGQMTIRYAKAMGLKVFVVDTNSRKLDQAKRLGAEYTINPNQFSNYANDIK